MYGDVCMKFVWNVICVCVLSRLFGVEFWSTFWRCRCWILFKSSSFCKLRIFHLNIPKRSLVKSFMGCRAVWVWESRSTPEYLMVAGLGIRWDQSILAPQGGRRPRLLEHCAVADFCFSFPIDSALLLEAVEFVRMPMLVWLTYGNVWDMLSSVEMESQTVQITLQEDS